MTLNSRIADKNSFLIFIVILSGFLYICYLSFPHISYLYKLDRKTEDCLNSYFEDLPQKIKLAATTGKTANDVGGTEDSGQPHNLSNSVTKLNSDVPFVVSPKKSVTKNYSGPIVDDGGDAEYSGHSYNLDESIPADNSATKSNSELQYALNQNDLHPTSRKVSGPKRDLEKPIMVLIVTFWRSGSTWLGEMLSKTPNTFYLFEPVQMLTSDIHYDIGYNISSTEASSVIRQLLLCSISKEFVEFSKMWSMVYAKKYCKDKSCLNYLNISNHCLSSDYRIIKTVRMGIEKVEELFTYPTLSYLKVIFLVRDPRGTANSFSHLKQDFEGRFWTLGFKEICPRLEENINAFKQLKRKFPDRLFFVRYEDLAINPIEKSLEIWKFIHSSQETNGTTLPKEWLSFISESMAIKNNTLSKNIRDRLHVTRRSTQEWQSWRNNISNKLLTTVQEYCRPLIEALGYVIFNNPHEARNVSLDVLSVKNCSQIPCLENVKLDK